ncbi:hypothetical protein BKA67DRAFT_663300 [Truncatella angustata]|uniref:Uncharacterized protein n=1 Tax=Truncatella angustata TaxID=152316 RepID=A0A9P8RNW8_9PEZI|nr:uncharacterized protein BKA67DRAFT_663300 [Truncatella angustata]KAH6646935.1 hypothetical protein BKA67DRAFT_663300 [Truncatella angustata]KAH8197464.1 hypothetical protein TruAng_008359 [Truncatella angustata]
MGERYRKQCAGALNELRREYESVAFYISSRSGKYERRIDFNNGIYIQFISTREGLRSVDLRNPRLVDALVDMAETEGLRGRTMVYGVAAYFGKHSDEALKKHQQYDAEREY